MNRIISLFLGLLFLSTALPGQTWEIQSLRSIKKENPESYSDNIEMAGKKVAGIIHYEVDSLGMLSVEREIIFPQLRRFIGENESKWKKYRAYLKEIWSDDIEPKIYLNDQHWLPGKVSDITIDGRLIINHATTASGLSLERTFFPSTEHRLFIEQWKLKNETTSAVGLKFGKVELEKVAHGNYGKYSYGVRADTPDNISLLAGNSITITIKYWADNNDIVTPDPLEEFEKRARFLDQIHSKLILTTPNEVLNTLFAFSKVRATESIFDSKMGIVHSPGGGRYYAGVWANDQAEYSGPFFPYLGVEDGNTAALNAYKKFYDQMKTIPNHDKNLWSSFEMDGEIPCCGGDRGDAAMIAYGGLHYLLALGDQEEARTYEPMIDWCLEYSHKKLNQEGVVASDTDEMEGRIETGNANLSTSSLYYGALDLAIDFYSALQGNYQTRIEELKHRKEALEGSIESYFGANVEGLDTYKYYKEHQHLRHWICLPLVVGIHNRSEATTEALFERLWTENGVHVEKNSTNPEISKIFWDRGTLYALRGTFAAGATEKSLSRLEEFSRERLLGKRVPYVVEAYPEGSMAHLSAESALYCRVFIEGLFGIKPNGFNSFYLTPQMPANWDHMALKEIHAFGAVHSIEIHRVTTGLQVIVSSDEKSIRQVYDVQNGDTIKVSL